MPATSPLIEALELATTLQHHVVVDCRADLLDPRAADLAYAAGHVPGARYADLDRVLSGPRRPGLGRHPLPEPGALANTLGAWGITNDTSVVVYDAATSAYAARLWWLLRWIGHENVRVLNGGYAAWLCAGLPSEKDCPQPQAAPYRVGEVRSQWVVSTAEIESHLSSGLCLVDVRTEPRFEGREEPIDSVAGHVPGASNYPLASSLDADGRFLPPDLLRPRLRSLLQGSPPEHAIAMCGSGVTACHFLLSMAVAGLPLGRLYAGSWSEWIASPGRPVATCL